MTLGGRLSSIFVKLSEHLRFLGHETHSNSSFSSSFVLFLKSWSAPPLQTRLRLPRPSCHAHASDCLASTGRFLDFLLLSKNAFCLKMVEKFCSLWRNFCLEQSAQSKKCLNFKLSESHACKIIVPTKVRHQLMRFPVPDVCLLHFSLCKIKKLLDVLSFSGVCAAISCCVLIWLNLIHQTYLVFAR